MVPSSSSGSSTRLDATSGLPKFEDDGEGSAVGDCSNDRRLRDLVEDVDIISWTAAYNLDRGRRQKIWNENSVRS